MKLCEEMFACRKFLLLFMFKYVFMMLRKLTTIILMLLFLLSFFRNLHKVKRVFKLIIIISCLVKSLEHIQIYVPKIICSNQRSKCKNDSRLMRFSRITTLLYLLSVILHFVILHRINNLDELPTTGLFLNDLNSHGLSRELVLAGWQHCSRQV